ncbi:hypothetical protein AB0B50_35200 [Streptomyces sp. NPDC041068]|uniref:hypothetical protein n=1 Tax=Streptomyces sp. NPDC041068 TaxID=3155130 RepID=UPI0033E1E48A
MTTSAPTIRPGDVRTRAEIRQELGGSPQGGICPSESKKTVVLFSDIKAGEPYGYRDGWLTEEDDLGPIFAYTGAGTKGDQTFGGLYGKGNSAVLDHATRGRTLHLFIAEGKVQGSGARTHRYVGPFKVDEREPYQLRQARDENQADRSVIVFRLRPAGEVYRSDAHTLPRAKATRPIFFRAREATRLARAQRRQRNQHRTLTPDDVAAQRRDELSESYESRLEQAGHSVGYLQVEVKDKTSTLISDLYDESDNTLYETAGSTSREAVRSALAQLLDLSRYLRLMEHSQPLRLMVLSPELPDADIRELLEEHNVGVIYRNEAGDFSEFQGERRTPGGRAGAPPFPCAECPALSS